MTCAKKTVTCTLHLLNSSTIVGTNYCNAPQEKCPRLPGEGYEKCVAICQQEGHAEDIALRKAGIHARGAVAIVEGIGHVCKECQHKMKEAGIAEFKLIYGRK